MTSVTITPDTMSEAKAHATMQQVNCPRCGGLMVPDRFIDLLDDTGQLEFMAARCVSCGEVLDPVILQNRHHQADARRAAAPALGLDADTAQHPTAA